MFVLAVAIGVIPIPWAYATFYLSRFLYRRATIGLVPGDHRFNDVWNSTFGWAMPVYLVVLPVAIVTLTAILVRMERLVHGRRWRSATALSLIALVLGAASWIVAFFELATTIWNQ
jgi:hypothetical protein